MSIKVQNLTKVYNKQTAVNNVSFELSPGEVVGFLGPNGAGKSTTMKMMVGNLTPTAGNIEVIGYSPVQSPLDVQTRVGYLPEHNPLYLDMYVHEFLHFMSSLHGLKDISSTVKTTVELCGLTKEQNKKIGTLSKGYRQRVGLARALLHAPEVLILDEPTTGLDPNQIVEVRNIIKNASANRTTIFSSHILSEVEAICDRILIINEGNLLVDQSLHDLKRSFDMTQTITVSFDNSLSIELIRDIQVVEKVIQKSDGVFKIETGNVNELKAKLMQLGAEEGVLIEQFKVVELSLEDVFQSVTKGGGL